MPDIEEFPDPSVIEEFPDQEAKPSGGFVDYKIKTEPWQYPGFYQGPLSSNPWSPYREEAIAEAKAISLPAILTGATEAAGKGIVKLADVPTNLMNWMRGATPESPAYVTPLAETPRPKLPRMPGEDVVSGAINTGIGLVESMVPPFAPPEIGLSLPILGGKNLVSKVGGTMLGADMLSNLPESISQAVEVAKDPETTPAQKTEAIAQPITQALMGAGMLKHGISEKPAVQVGPIATGEILKMPKGARPEADQLIANAEAALPAAAAEAKKGVTSASEVSQATEVYGDVRPREEPAQVVPVSGSGEGIQPQATGGIPEAQGPVGASTGQERILLESQAKPSPVAQETAPVAPAPTGGIGESSKGVVEPTSATPPPAISEAKPVGEIPQVGEAQGVAMPAAPLAPTPTPAAPIVPVKAMSQVIRDLAVGLNVPIRFKRLTTSKFGGYFKPIQNLIGSKRPNDIPVVSHEVGHKLDQLLSFSGNTAIEPELHILGDPATSGSLSSWTPKKTIKYKLGEGVAEFVRRWAVDPAQTAKMAPNMNAAFEAAMNANPDLGKVMRQAQQDIALWRNAQPEARLRSSISTENPNGTRYGLSELTRDLVDDLHFIRMMRDDAKTSGDITPSKDPYQLSRALRGSYGMAETFIRKGIVNAKTGAVQLGTGLENALKPVSGDIDAFRTWMVAKRAKELISQGKETGLVPADVDFVVSKYDSNPAFQDAFNKIKQWNDGLLQYAVDNELISPESAQKMRDLNQDYVPFHRVMEVGAGEAPSELSAGVGRGLQVGKPGSLKGLKGSRRDIVDPLETMIRNAYTIITASEKNRVSGALADLEPRRDMGRWIERVSAPKEAVRVELERIRKQLEDAGADVSMLPDDFLMMFWKPSKRAPFGENTIAVTRAGKTAFYRLNKDVYDTFHALDYEDSGRIIRILSQPAQILRAGVTLDPNFALFNALRDTVSAAVLSKHGALPFVNTLKGLGILLKNPQIVAEWAAAGGKQSIEASYFDRNKLQAFLSEKITKDLTPEEQALVYLKSPLAALRLLTGTFEEATRLGEYKLAYDDYIKKGMSPIDARRQAAFEARDLQDFAKGGAHTKIIRRLAAFWNAALQGNVRLFQAAKERPIQTLLKGTAFVTLPKLLEQALNWNDEDYWDRPQWERDLFFMIPFGKDKNNHTKFIRIPTPFEVGLIFGTLPGRVIQYAREKDKAALSSYFSTLLKQTLPNPMPNASLVPLEIGAGRQGYSYWRGRPIVSEALKDAPVEMQFTEQTSLTAKHVGDLIGVSPQKVDYAIGGLTGGVGRQVVSQGLDRAIQSVTGEERTATGITPLGRFFTSPAGTQSAAIEAFYQHRTKVFEDEARQKAGAKSTGLYEEAKMMRQVSTELSKLRELTRREKDPTERQKLNLEMVDLAKRANEVVKKRSEATK